MKTATSIILAITVLGTVVILLHRKPFIRPHESMTENPSPIGNELPAEALVQRTQRNNSPEISHSRYSASNSITADRLLSEEESSAAISRELHPSNRNNVVAERASRTIPLRSEAPPTSPYPAVWIDLPGAINFTPAQQAEIQKNAESLLEELVSVDQAGLPESAKAELINASDLDFRRKYGVRAWLSHHAQARAIFGGMNGK